MKANLTGTPQGYIMLIMQRIITFSISCLVFLFSLETHSRAISYPGGYTIMERTDNKMSRIHIHYTSAVDTSLGITTEHFWEEKIQNIYFQANHLLKRINTRTTQFNCYLKNLIGIQINENAHYPKAAFRIAADWESRRLFSAYFVEADQKVRETNFHINHFVKLGIAPYLAEYGALHTWIMVETTFPEHENYKPRVTPLLRIFKGDYLTEIGYASNKTLLVNFMIRF